MFKHRYRWVVAILLFFAGMLNYLDRAALSVMAPLVKDDLGLNDAQMGMIFSSFFIGYCLFCFIGGYCADKYGPRKTYAWSAGIWSLFCGITGLVTGFVQLLVIRVLFGIGEGPMGTTTNKSIANWFPQKEVGRAVGFVNAGQPLGAALAAPIVGFVGLHFGWRISFVVIAVLGFIWVAFWLIFFRDKPENSSRTSKEEVDLIVNERPSAASEKKALEAVNNQSQTTEPKHSIFYYVLSLPVLGVAISFFCFNYIQFFFLSWLPSYLTDYQHLDIKSMSIVGILPWLGAAVGFLGGGIITDFLYKLTKNFVTARKIVIFVGLAVASICVLATAYASSVVSAVTLITVACLFGYMVPQACWSLLQYIVPSARIGSAGGFVHLLANLAGILSPGITGFLIQYGGGYQSAFILASILAAFGIISLLLFIQNKKVEQFRIQ
ncbi:MFS transporter [Zophobihabitans entericus]|uniref:MFS transporter n=1 Tax=Zophobihabitans entericus TaxID=1635327 RepID=A0A6G9IBB9_9GAMM|nr:MFS transporter [Zophobihabitans entericus]QIQ21127.1 MFS transporter [Zophobihabitans entericus]